MTAGAGLQRLMLVTDRGRTRGPDWIESVAAAANGGAGIVQVRENDLADDDLRKAVLKLKERLPPSTGLVVNGNGRVAAACGAGLHLPAKAKRVPRGRFSPLGRSAHDGTEVAAAIAERVDYIILGTIFRTPSKRGHPGAGVEFLEEMCRLAHPTPVYAIGGIQVSGVPSLIQAGAYGVAVCGAILSVSDPRRAAEAFALALAVAVGS